MTSTAQAMNKKLVQPIKWHGGKSYLAPWIISMMCEHTHYVEVFGGGCSVLLRKDPADISEVVNDIDGALMNFWRVLRSQEHFEQMQRVVQATPMSEDLFQESAEQIEPAGDEPDVSAAVNFFIRARQSRQGLMKDFATLSRNRTRRRMNEQSSAWLTGIDGLPAVHHRLQRVVILNRDALGVIRTQDGSNTLYYLDPPYLPETRTATSAYRHEMSVDDHEELLKTMANIQGKFLLSGYPSTLYNEFARRHGWHRVEKQIDNKASGAKTKRNMVECIWANYPLPEST